MGTPQSHKARATQTEGRLHLGEQGQCPVTSCDTRAPGRRGPPGTIQPGVSLEAYSPGDTVLAPGSSQNALLSLKPSCLSPGPGSGQGQEAPPREGETKEVGRFGQEDKLRESSDCFPRYLPC